MYAFLYLDFARHPHINRSPKQASNFAQGGSFCFRCDYLYIFQGRTPYISFVPLRSSELFFFLFDILERERDLEGIGVFFLRTRIPA